MRRLYHPDLLYEVTIRTIDGRWWFPQECQHLRAAVLGAMSTAQRRFPIRIHAFTFMSNHYHAIYGADHPDLIAGFLGHFHAALARIANRRAVRTGPVWASRASVIPILLEEQAQLQRLAYVMGQAVRAGAAAHPEEWPAASSTPWLLRGEQLVGTRVDWTRRSLDGRNGHEPGPVSNYEESCEVRMTPLPCFAGLSEDERRATCRAIADELASRHGWVQREADPGGGELQSRPTQVGPEDAVIRTSPAPTRKRRKAVHTASIRGLRRFLALRAAFDSAYDEARRRLRVEAGRAARGERAAFVLFPAWSFPPGAPTAEAARATQRDQDFIFNINM